jgi:hypothetical protein
MLAASSSNLIVVWNIQQQQSEGSPIYASGASFRKLIFRGNSLFKRTLFAVDYDGEVIAWDLDDKRFGETPPSTQQ